MDLPGYLRWVFFILVVVALTSSHATETTSDSSSVSSSLEPLPIDPAASDLQLASIYKYNSLWYLLSPGSEQYHFSGSAIMFVLVHWYFLPEDFLGIFRSDHVWKEEMFESLQGAEPFIAGLLVALRLLGYVLLLFPAASMRLDHVSLSIYPLCLAAHLFLDAGFGAIAPYFFKKNSKLMKLLDSIFLGTKVFLGLTVDTPSVGLNRSRMSTSGHMLTLSVLFISEFTEGVKLLMRPSPEEKKDLYLKASWALLTGFTFVLFYTDVTINSLLVLGFFMESLASAATRAYQSSWLGTLVVFAWPLRLYYSDTLLPIPTRISATALTSQYGVNARLAKKILFLHTLGRDDGLYAGFSEQDLIDVLGLMEDADEPALKALCKYLKGSNKGLGLAREAYEAILTDTTRYPRVNSESLKDRIKGLTICLSQEVPAKIVPTTGHESTLPAP